MLSYNSPTMIPPSTSFSAKTSLLITFRSLITAVSRQSRTLLGIYVGVGCRVDHEPILGGNKRTENAVLLDDIV